MSVLEEVKGAAPVLRNRLGEVENGAVQAWSNLAMLQGLVRRGLPAWGRQSGPGPCRPVSRGASARARAGFRGASRLRVVRQGFVCGAIFTVVLLALPGVAGATRPASEQEISDFKAAARVVEAITECAHPLLATASGNCEWVPREGYEPLVSDARVSTLDASWATAYLTPAPRTTEAETVIFRKEVGSGIWRMGVGGNGCELTQRSFGANHGTEIRLAPDLASAMGCTPQIPTKVRCVDKFRTWLLALEMPQQCAVAGPADSLIGWMNIRELHWRQWGDDQGASALGVLKGVPSRLLRKRLSTHGSQPGISDAVPLPPFTVRLMGSERVSCGTSYFYARLRVVSAFGRFGVTLPTCPDQFFAPR